MVDKNEVYIGIVRCTAHKDIELRRVMLRVLEEINTTHSIPAPESKDLARTASLMALAWEAGRHYNTTQDLFTD